MLGLTITGEGGKIHHDSLGSSTCGGVVTKIAVAGNDHVILHGNVLGVEADVEYRMQTLAVLLPHTSSNASSGYRVEQPGNQMCVAHSCASSDGII